MSAENPTNPPKNESLQSVQSVAEEGIEEAAQTDAEVFDSLTTVEQVNLETGKSLKDIKREQKLGEQHEVHETRLGYVLKLFCLIVIWLFIASLFVAFHGFHLWGFELSEKVLIALITSTTANVLGLFYVVAKWLYPAPLAKEAKTKKIKARISASTDEE